MTRATGVGSVPGPGTADPAEAFREAVRRTSEAYAPLAHLPEMPGRGVGAEMVGRTLGLIDELGADVQPAGWRLTEASGQSGRDQRRARSLLDHDLDILEEEAGGSGGYGSTGDDLKIQVAGPWTLAASVEKPRGDRVLGDHGARRELAEALAEAVTRHVADVQRRVPGARVVLQVDEPALPAVMAARIPTASGFGKHRRVDPPVASALLETVLGAARGAGAVPVVHCCAASPPTGLLAGAGAAGISVDLGVLTTAAYDPLAERFDAGDLVLLGVAPSTGPATGEPAGDSAVLNRVRRLLDMLGLDPAEVGEQLVLTPACGLAGAHPAYARHVMAQLPRVARQLDEA
ncbi:methionine synthase [Nocardioidaceae bacterium]|nr:methionine synthase [Nocardioidaceae bacterium]